MRFDKQHMLLYAVTDRDWIGERTLYQQVEDALKGGITCVQLRENPWTIQLSFWKLKSAFQQQTYRKNRAPFFFIENPLVIDRSLLCLCNMSG